MAPLRAHVPRSGDSSYVHHTPSTCPSRVFHAAQDRSCPGDVAEIRLDLRTIEEHLPGVVEAFFFTSDAGEVTARSAAAAFVEAYPSVQQRGETAPPVVYLDFHRWERAPFVLN